MDARGGKNRDARLPAAWSSVPQPSKFLQLSHLRRLKSCEQVAAVCYRVSIRGIEFLLVQTRGGRWTFPKGSAEPGLTHAQAAALEAFEEAGVHGRMEEASFTRYFRKRPGSSAARNGDRLAEKELAVNAHLCQVSRLESPQEGDRNPTWFSADQAKRHLREGRKADYGSELARVIDRAVTRVRLTRSTTSRTPPESQKDALQKVRFIDGDWHDSGSRRRPSRRNRGTEQIADLPRVRSLSLMPRG